MPKSNKAKPTAADDAASRAAARNTDSAPAMLDEEVDRPSNEDATSESLGASASREDRIRIAAYAAAERRGFAPGFETDDWLEAERQVDAQGSDDPSA